MITQDMLKEVLDYNPDTGIATFKSTRGGVMPGTKVGYETKDGYTRVKILNQRHFLHRLAFLYMDGSMPEFVDHINGDTSDNRWVNLRPASHQQNVHNRSWKRKSGASGVKGVYWTSRINKWRPVVGMNGKKVHVGYFYDLIGAELAVRKARIELHGEFANHG